MKGVPFRGIVREMADRVRGYVYFIRGGDGTYKIGHTNNMRRRVAQLRSKYPHKSMEPALVIRAADRYKTETQLHRRFSPKRVEDEWFALDESDVDAIRSRFQGYIEE